MNGQKEFEKIMEKAERIALASAVDNTPNVRIVNFVFEASKKVLYFVSTKGDPKEAEFLKNSNVAFTTIPTKGLAHIRVHYATVTKSKKSVFDAADMFIAKMPWYKENIEQNGNEMNLYEVHFTTATVLVGPDKALSVEL
ncbi:MAG: pyridoxamine 5'-phosphate oxidase family protein [Campylobacteraceae bacterium]|jgi:uncharacterized pyridoxamine 5'-phosphate oxidase family protein|nr:pyridoxamine 5'-phosphate oxidase family protein [Campylobacteraceae bacterium]